MSTAEAEAVTINDYPGLREWRLNGEHGISSEAIADRLQYGETSMVWRGSNYPRDPSDFRRCELLLRRAPSMRAGLPLMADQGPEWAALVKNWEAIAQMIESEVPGAFDGRPPYALAYRSYAYMQYLIRGVLIVPGMDERVKIGRRGRTVWTVVGIGYDDTSSLIPWALTLRSNRGTQRAVEGSQLADIWKVTA